MRNLNRVVIVLLLITANISIFSQEITATQYATIINLSGRQRMLTQKMSKEMLLIAAKIDETANIENLKNTSNLFGVTLDGLISGNNELGLPQTKDKKILLMLNKVKVQWAELKMIVDSVISGAAVPVTKIAELNLPLLKNMNTCVRLYERSAKKNTGISAGTVINLAGKQRMLSQKMAKEVLLIALDYKKDETRSILKQTASLFDRTLKGLKDGDPGLELPGTKDQQIVDQLNKVETLWLDYKAVINRTTDIDSAGISREDLIKVASLNLPVLKEMNKAVKMFELSS